MNQYYHHERFNFFVVVIVIAIIALAALSRYSIMASDARIMRLEIISHHFMTGAANARVEFLLHTIANKNITEPQYLMIEGNTLYFSSQGWPASTSAVVTNAYQPTDEDCYQLWTLLLQNPTAIGKLGDLKTRSEYRTTATKEACRYKLATEHAYFDYFPMTGRLLFYRQY